MKYFKDERNNPSCNPGFPSGPRELIERDFCFYCSSRREFDQKLKVSSPGTQNNKLFKNIVHVESYKPSESDRCMVKNRTIEQAL